MTTQTDWVPEDTFAGRLLLLRHELGESTEALAARCGLKHQTWSTWERGSSPRNMSAVVAAISLATGVDRDWLMWGGQLRPAGQSSAGRSLTDTELMQYRSLLRSAA